ncbi:toxin-antitoxin system YwqK family antitoxin [Hymenobacter psychrophilus]|uniref:MORN repeat variant n=1 Tax=Hymenobacter psychrophilus TaxID=651662 RepID=A0A1H3LCL2_9BACT|nr:hypothetical protein [Hymenobacter psychrophilus]SDY61684.1 hypothetical protein SAMN04488069_110184 [Hymenobacter psychrophilus]
MAPKARSLFSIGALVCGLALAGCSQPAELVGQEAPAKTVGPVDVSQVPDTTVARTDAALNLHNGVYYLGSKPYSGFVQELYPTGAVKSNASYYAGRQHGLTRTFWADGRPHEVRSYRAGLAYGRHTGFWPNGHRKFDFVYADDKREGSHKQWYESGNIYCDLNFADDQEVGRQQAWRENGKVYINYAVRDGVRYGLQKSALCYTLRDGQLK